MFKKITRSGFTLIEMLIVIVIIGILSAAIIPRLTGIQARARDTARIADIRNSSIAIESYHADHGSYPIAVYAYTDIQPKKPLFISSVFAQAQGSGSSLDTVSALLSNYITSLPTDPDGSGVQASSDGSCLTQGKSYAYHTDTVGSFFAITATKESKRGNASSCNNTIDKAGDGSYEKVGKGLTTLSREDSDVSCFDFDEDTGTITAFTCLLSVSYYEDPALNTGYNDYKDVVIPAKINDIDVRAIGLGAFWSLKITSLIIPDSVTSIGLGAFSNNLLTEVDLPSGLEFIGNAAFSTNNLTSITIPNSVTTIDQGAFYNNKLTSIAIPSGISSIGKGVFQSNQLTSVTIPTNITNIGNDAFADNKLTSITIPNTVTSIGLFAFEYNYLESLSLPASVTFVGKDAFKSNGPQRVSNGLTDFVPNTNQAWITAGTHPQYPSLNGINWVKQ